MSFASLGLCDALLKTVAQQAYTTASPIQIKAIPAVLSQRDVLAVAQTGTGKTAAFVLPIVQLLSAGSKAQPKCMRALIVAPTRELAAQIAASVQTYTRHLSICSASVFGGVRVEPQIAELQKGVDVLIATPGRLIDLYNQGAISFQQLEIVVLDEADRMLDLGFIDEIRTIQELLPSKRQTLLFSATFSKAVKSLACGMLNKPVLLEVVAAKSTAELIKQSLHPVDKERKAALLIHLIKKGKWQQVLVFCRTKQGADSLASQLGNAGISAASIHANRTQHARTHALEGFKAGSISVLVATDIASRGIDINQLTCVINVDLPYVPEDYVHRIGRTGRAGNLGFAISLFSDDEAKQLRAIERVLGFKLKPEIIAGFAPKAKVVADASDSSDDDEYGNFEPDVKRRRSQSDGRNARGAKKSKRR